MFDKIWELFTSDEKLDKLFTRSLVVGFAILIFVIAYKSSAALLTALGLIILGVIIVTVMIRKSDKRAEEEWQKLLNEEDDGETGYIAVRPEELESAPWELRKPDLGRGNIHKEHNDDREQI